MGARVVFIHLGKSVPKFLEKNLLRTRHLFPKLEILVAGQTPFLEGITKKIDANYWPVSNSFGSPELAPPGLARQGLDTKFWNGYWQKTFDRLLVLAEVHEHISEGALIHVESDVILTRDFPFESLAKSSQLMWGAYSDDADIASIVFSPSRGNSRWLANELVEVARLDDTATDMSALAVLRKQNADKIRLLPATPELAASPNHPGAVFDGLHIGEWIFGWDPKAHWGFKRRRLKINPHSELVAGGSLELRGDALVLITNGTEARVSNLHVHSKELKYFEPDITESLSRLLKTVSRPRAFYGFTPTGFFSWLLSRVGRWSTTLLKFAARALTRD